MKKIDFKKPRYALPLVCFPFLLLFFYVYKSSFGKQQPIVVGRDSLQSGLVGVSGQVRDGRISGKLDAFRNAFKKGDGYTAVGGIAEEQQESVQLNSGYSQKEKRMLDSIDQLMKGKLTAPAQEPGNPHYSNFTNPASHSDASAQNRALLAALAKIKQPAPLEPTISSPRRPAEDPMALFRAQMALVDSMGKANDPQEQAKARQDKMQKEADLLAKGKKTLIVSKASSSPSLFNSVSADETEEPITALIDQDLTGYSGSRLRIRLLEDILVGKTIIKKGTYLYALISGFSAQRVQLKISSIFSNGKVLPIHLDIYDNDGMAGIYVPSSAFREFTRELGSSSSQGLSLQQQAENNQQLVMGILEKMFSSTTTAVNKLIRSNKAKMKYNTQVYLIDPNELKNKQQSY
jgi:conjugative transposon TraM protein